MEKPYRIGFLPLVDVPKKKLFDWKHYSYLSFKVVMALALSALFGYLIRAGFSDAAENKERDNQCKVMGAIDVQSCSNCLWQSSIPNDPRCGSVNRWNK
jgi:hypothetical protein